MQALEALKIAAKIGSILAYVHVYMYNYVTKQNVLSFGSLTPAPSVVLAADASV